MRTNAASAAAEVDNVNQTDRDPTVDTIHRLEVVQLQLAERVRAAPSENLPMDECDYMEVFGARARVGCR